MIMDFLKERLMTQDEIADKYDEDKTTVCNAIKLADLKPADKAKTKTKRMNLYREIDALAALIQLYRNRRDDFLKHAEKWQRAEDLAMKIYQESYEET